MTITSEFVMWGITERQIETKNLLKGACRYCVVQYLVGGREAPVGGPVSGRG